MLITVDEVKKYLKLDDYDEENELLRLLIENAELYIEDAVCSIEKMGQKSKKKAKLLALVLVSDFYENRGLNINANKNMNLSEKVRYSVQSIILQLKLRNDV